MRMGSSRTRVRNAMGKLGKVFGLQGTGGSTSTRDGFVKMREAGAAARLMLVAAAGVKTRCPEHRVRDFRWHHSAQGIGQVADLWRGRSGRGFAGGSDRSSAKGQVRLEAARQAAEARRHVGQGHRRPDLRYRCDAAGHALRHGEAQPALLGEAAQGGYIQSRKDAGRCQDRAAGDELWPWFRRHRRKYLGGVQGCGGDRGGMGTARISAGQRGGFANAGRQPVVAAMARPCATMAMSIPPSPTHRAKGS